MCQAARACHNNGLIASVSSLLISLVMKPLAKSAILTGRSILALVAGDGDSSSVVAVADAPRAALRSLRRVRRRRAPVGPDAAAVIASLGLAVSHGDDDDDDDDGMVECGGARRCRWWRRWRGSKEAGEAELREAFGLFDRDGDGWMVAAAARHGDATGGVDAAGFLEFRAMMEHAV
ncbi:hypothetical protein ZWY2020_037665 [Hordeum vulgare]|nr:hypothetical protein ZWY2020_037665 [Hordeum vulgare]